MDTKTHSKALLGFVVWGMAWLLAPLAIATIVVPKLMTCPLCERQFMSSAIVTWTQFREPERDSGAVVGPSPRVLTCPHCLYSALPSEFRFTEFGESNAVWKALTELRQRIRPLPEPLQLEALQNADYWGVEFLRYRIAEVCDAAREPDPVRTAELRHASYLNLKYVEDAALVAGERSRAIEAFEIAARPTHPRRSNDLYWTYLAGELRRCAGDTNGAMASLDEAVRLAGGPSAEFKKGHLGQWAVEQAAKARRGDTNDSPRTPMYGPERQEQQRTVQRRLPEMVAALNSGKPPSEWLLEGKARLNTVSLVRDLAKEGNQDAVKYLFGWLARLEDSELKSRDYQVQQAARLLGSHGEQISDDTIAQTKFRVAALGEAATYAVRGGPLPANIRRSLQSDDALSVPVQASISAATARRDYAVKALLLERLKESEEPYLADLVKDYFSMVGVPSDIPALESFASRFISERNGGRLDWTGFKCRDIEDAIRLIRLRRILSGGG